MSEQTKPAKPKVFTPTIRIPQPDGSVILRPGRPMVLEDMINTAEAAGILGMSQRWITWQCELGEFRSAYKPGGRERCRWRLAREEVLARRNAAAAR